MFTKVCPRFSSNFEFSVCFAIHLVNWLAQLCAQPMKILNFFSAQKANVLPEFFHAENFIGLTNKKGGADKACAVFACKIVIECVL